MYRSSTIFEDHANYACYLLARVLGLFAGSGMSLGTSTLGTGSPEQASYTDNWSRLFDCIENWHLDQLEEMKAVLSLGADTSHDSNPFQTLLFGNGAASKPLHWHVMMELCLTHSQYLVINSTTQQHCLCSRKSHMVWRRSRLVGSIF